MPQETYILYSIRNNITDKDLAGLLDYLEREMGWDIKYTDHDSTKYIENGWLKIVSFDDEEIHIYTDACADIVMPLELFFRTYRTLLPVIRDLCSKI